METVAFLIVEVVGAIVILMGVIICGVLFVGWLHDRSGEPYKPSYDEGYQHALTNLKADSIWFSEDYATMRLLHDLSTGLNVSDARERWRKARSEAARPAPPPATIGETA